MRYEEETFFEMENIRSVERVVRVAASIAIIVAVLSIPAITTYILFALTLITIYSGLTAFIGWDPVYAALNRNALREATLRPTSPIFSYSKRGVEHPTSGHRQAA